MLIMNFCHYKDNMNKNTETNSLAQSPWIKLAHWTKLQSSK